MVLSIKKAACADYYWRTDGLLTKRELGDGSWCQDVPALGVSKEAVFRNVLDDLLNRRAGTFGNRPLFSLKDGQSGTDFAFSAPKSVSLMWALAAPDVRRAIEDAQYCSVLDAADVLAEEAIYERRGAGGRTLRRAHAAMATFLHTLGRPVQRWIGGDIQQNVLTADPHLHTHLVVPDIVAAAPPDDKANSSERILKIAYTALYGRWAMALGAWYHANLAARLNGLGFAVEAAGPNGLFRLKGCSPEWVRAFSSRGLEVENWPANKRAGILSANKKAILALKAEDYRRHWHEIAKDLAIPRDWLEPRRCSAEKAPVTVKESGKQLESADAVLQRQDLFQAVAIACVANGASVRPQKSDVELLAKSPILVPIGMTRSYALPQWSLASNLESENEVLRLASQLSKMETLPMDTVSMEGGLEWTFEQREAIRACLSGLRLVCIVGAPGTGKTALLAPVLAAYRAIYPNGEVIGAAEAWQTALMLKKQFRITAFALAALVKRYGAEKIRLPKGSLLIVDEAGLLSTARMLEILEMVEQKGIRLILLGDSQQLNPIGVGSGLRLVQSVVQSVELTQVVRQSDPQAKELVEDVIRVGRLKSRRSTLDGDNGGPSDWPHDAFARIAQALVDQERWLSFPESHGAVSAIVDQLWPQLKEVAERVGARAPVAMARSHQETHHIARSLRKKLLAVGVLSGPEYSIPSVTPMGSSYRLSLAAGDWIRFQVKDNDLGVFNGSTGRLVEIRQRVGEKLDLKVALDDNPSNVISFPSTQICDGSGQIQLSHGYATTIYSAQGATFDEVLLLRSRRMTFREFYVALTRARQRFTVFEANRSRLDAFKRNGSKDDLVAHLANELSVTKHRDVPKALALDFPLNEVSAQPVQDEGERQGEWLWSIFNADAISQSPKASLTWLDTPNRPHKRQKRTRVG